MNIPNPCKANAAPTLYAGSLANILYKTAHANSIPKIGVTRKTKDNSEIGTIAEPWFLDVLVDWGGAVPEAVVLAVVAAEVELLVGDDDPEAVDFGAAPGTSYSTLATIQEEKQHLLQL